MTSTPRTASFEATLAGSGGKTGIVVPPDAVEQLAAGRRPPVHVEVNGCACRSTVAVMGGQYLVGVNADVRAATGLAAGDRRYHVDAVTGAKSAETRQRRIDTAVALVRSGRKR